MDWNKITAKFTTVVLAKVENHETIAIFMEVLNKETLVAVIAVND